MNPMKTKAIKLANRKAPERIPNIHPGYIIRTQVLEARGLTQSQLATATGITISRINDLIHERRGITVDTAIRLGRALGQPPQFWLNLQTRYDMEEAMLARQKEYSAIKPLPLTIAEAA